MKTIPRFLVALAAVLFLLQQSAAQGILKGKAVDENGEPLIGATIMLVGSSRGTATDFNGNYALGKVPTGKQSFRASYTGYGDVTQAVMIKDGETATLDFTLGKDAETREEVVVIGYGSVRKEDITGAVAKVETKDFNRGAIVSPEQLIAGKVAGVQITPDDGAPGGGSSIRIRGATSVNAGNEPLYVIDGMPIDNEGFARGRNPLNFINPADIESFTVLKDASATAIYGSRGANGVIVITTKKGEVGSYPRVNYDGYVTRSEIRGEPGMLNADRFRDVVTSTNPGRLSLLGNANTNWFDEVLRVAYGQSHSLGVSGGGQHSGYRFSAGYQNIEGILGSSETERINFGLNYNHRFFGDKLLINTNVRGARTHDVFNLGIGAAWDFDPTQPVFDPSNEAFAGYNEYGNPLAPRNPVSAVEQREDQGQSFRTLGNVDVEYRLDELLEGLSIKVNLGFDVNQGSRNRFEPTTYTNQMAGADFAGLISLEDYTRTNYLFDAYLKYDRQIAKRSRLNLTLGYAYQDFNERYTGFTAQDLSSDQFGITGPQLAEETFPFNSIFENRLISFWGRAIYSFDERYVLTATLRRDGSTRFGPGNRWGLFPSAAIAWHILQEGFATGLKDIFSDLKLRASYGAVGNQEIGDYLYIPQYALSDQRAQYQIGVDDNGEPIFVSTVRPNTYETGLQWEETSSINAGLEFGFANGRIGGALEYYIQRTDKLLIEVDAPAGTNLVDHILTNVGEVENSGIELSLSAVAISGKDLTWNLNGNIAYNNNRVNNLGNTVGAAGIPRGGIDGAVGNNIQLIREGEEIDAFLVYEHILNDDGTPVSSDDNIDMYVDQLTVDTDGDGVPDMGDGVINEQDRRIFQSPNPDILYGLTSSLQFKGFDLRLTLRGSIGNYIYNNNASNRGNFDRIGALPGFVSNVHESVLATQFERPQYFSDYYIENASFMRLDNVTLGYTFMPKRGLSSLRAYVTATNPLVLTAYSGLDPEVGISGIDNTPYPRPTGLIFGLSLGL